MKAKKRRCHPRTSACGGLSTKRKEQQPTDDGIQHGRAKFSNLSSKIRMTIGKVNNVATRCGENFVAHDTNMRKDPTAWSGVALRLAARSAGFKDTCSLLQKSIRVLDISANLLFEYVCCIELPKLNSSTCASHTCQRGPPQTTQKEECTPALSKEF